MDQFKIEKIDCSSSAKMGLFVRITTNVDYMFGGEP